MFLPVELIHFYILTVTDLKPLGSGNFASVYLGELKSSNRFKRNAKPVAIKVFNSSSTSLDKTATSSLIEELKNMSRLMKIATRPPYLVKFYGACFQTPGN
jgi:serine/threonine protein kinase